MGMSNTTQGTEGWTRQTRSPFSWDGFGVRRGQSSHDLITFQRPQAPNTIGVMISIWILRGTQRFRLYHPDPKTKLYLNISSPLPSMAPNIFFIKYCLFSFIVLFICSKIFKASPLNEFLSHWSLHLHLIFSLLSADHYYELFASVKYICLTGVSLCHQCPSHLK